VYEQMLLLFGFIQSVENGQHFVKTVKLIFLPWYS